MNVCGDICDPKYAHPMYCDDECLATAEYIDEEVSGRCQRYYVPDYIQYRKCASGRESLAPPPKPTLAARRWTDCDDVAALRKRGQEYERGWVKATARELDLMIEIERLKREVAASKCAACCATGLVAGEWLIDPTDPRYDNPPLCPCQNLDQP